MGRVAKRQQANREALLRAAYDLFADRGFASAAVADIARRAEVATGSVYNYFANKEEILSAVLETYVTPVADQLHQVADRVEDPATRLAAGLRNVLLRAATDPAWGRFLVQLASVQGSFDVTLMTRMGEDLQAAWTSEVLPRPSREAVVISVLAGAVMGVLVAMDHGVVGAEDIDDLLLAMLRSAGLNDEAAADAITRSAVLLSTIDARR